MTELNARKEAVAAQAKALRAKAAVGGLYFKAYLPSDLAIWILDLVEKQIFDDPSEAVFVFMQEQRELEPHRDLREELLRRKLLAAMDDTSSARPLDEVMAALRARTAFPAEPAHWRELDPSNEGA